MLKATDVYMIFAYCKLTVTLIVQSHEKEMEAPSTLQFKTCETHLSQYVLDRISMSFTSLIS